MRSALALMLVAACSSPARDMRSDAGVDATDAAPYEFEHQTTDVLVTPMSVHWSQGDFVCGLESCPAETSGGVLSFAQRSDVTAYVPYELDVAEVGSRQLAGDDQQLFYTVGTRLDAMFVKRCSGTACTAMSIPRQLDIGPAVDANNVFWADSLDGTSYTIRRASRTGDGTDATVVVPAIDVRDATRDRLLQASGQLWWIARDGSLMQVAATGGTPTVVIDHADTIAAADDLVLVSRLIYGNAQPTNEIGTISGNGVYQPLISRTDGSVARFLTVAENAVWWSTGDGNIYSTPLAGGATTTSAVQMTDGPQVFAVLPDRFLVELTAHGLRSVPR